MRPSDPASPALYEQQKKMEENRSLLEEVTFKIQQTTSIHTRGHIEHIETGTHRTSLRWTLNDDFDFSHSKFRQFFKIKFLKILKRKNKNSQNSEFKCKTRTEQKTCCVFQLGCIKAESLCLNAERQREAEFLRQQENKLLRTNLCYLSLSRRITKYKPQTYQLINNHI